MSFDPMAVAIDWLDAYRANDLPMILDLYDSAATVECGCGGQQLIAGAGAIAEYWRLRLRDKPASDLLDLQPDGDGIIVSYGTSDGPVRATLHFSESGKIVRCCCEPSI